MGCDAISGGNFLLQTARRVLGGNFVVGKNGFYGRERVGIECFLLINIVGRSFCFSLVGCYIPAGPQCFALINSLASHDIPSIFSLLSDNYL